MDKGKSSLVGIKSHASKAEARHSAQLLAVIPAFDNLFVLVSRQSGVNTGSFVPIMQVYASLPKAFWD